MESHINRARGTKTGKETIDRKGGDRMGSTGKGNYLVSEIRNQQFLRPLW